MEQITSDPIFLLTGFILTVIGTVLAMLQIQKKKVFRLAYLIHNINLVKDETQEIKDLEIKYQGERIENLTVSEIYIWNGGNQIIDASHVAPLEPLNLSVDTRCRILETALVHVTDKIQNWKVNKEGEKHIITFDFIEPNNGIKVKVLHTGKKIEFNGKLKGIHISFQDIQLVSDESPSLISVWLLLLYIVGTSFFLVLYNIRPSILLSGTVLAFLVILSVLENRRHERFKRMRSVFHDFKSGDTFEK